MTNDFPWVGNAHQLISLRKMSVTFFIQRLLTFLFFLFQRFYIYGLYYSAGCILILLIIIIILNFTCVTKFPRSLGRYFYMFLFGLWYVIFKDTRSHWRRKMQHAVWREKYLGVTTTKSNYRVQTPQCLAPLWISS